MPWQTLWLLTCHVLMQVTYLAKFSIRLRRKWHRPQGGAERRVAQSRGAQFLHRKRNDDGKQWYSPLWTLPGVWGGSFFPASQWVCITAYLVLALPLLSTILLKLIALTQPASQRPGNYLPASSEGNIAIFFFFFFYFSQKVLPEIQSVISKKELSN